MFHGKLFDCPRLVMTVWVVLDGRPQADGTLHPMSLVWSVNCEIGNMLSLWTLSPWISCGTLGVPFFAVHPLIYFSLSTYQVSTLVQVEGNSKTAVYSRGQRLTIRFLF